MTNKDIKYTAALDSSGFLRGTGGMLTSLAQVEATAKGAVRGVQGSIDGMVGKFSGWAGVFTGLAASIGLISFAGMVKGALEGAAGLKRLSEQSGLSVENLSALRSVAKLSDTDLESVANASNKLAKNMAMADEKSAGAAQALKAVGLNVDEFKALSADDRLQVLARTLAQYQDGADKSAVAMALMGREGAKMLPFLTDLAEVGALQAKTTAEQAAQADELDKNFKRVRASGEGWKKELAYGMLPALNDVSRAVLDVFNGAGGLREQIKALAADGSIDRWTRNAVTGLTYVLDVVQYLGRGIGALGNTIGAAMAQLAALASGKWSEARNIGEEWRRSMAAVVNDKTFGQQIRDRMAELANAPKLAAEARTKLSFQARPDKEGKDDSRLPAWEAALAERKLNLAELANAEGSFREMSKAEEAAYWKEILDRTDLSEKERNAVRRKYAAAALEMRKDAFEAELEALKTERDEMEKNYGERTRIAREAYLKIAAAYGEESKEAKKAYGDVLAEHRKFVEQQRQLDLLAADRRREMRLADVELDRLLLQEQEALGTVSRAQVLQAEAELEQRIYQVRLQGLQDRLALIDPARDPVAYAQANAAIEQAELQHQQRLAQIQQQTRLDAASPIVGMLREIEGSWGSLLANMAKGATTIGGFARGLFRSVTDAVINSLAKMSAEWGVRQIAMRLFAKADSIGTVAREAGKAGAGGVASMAAAPFPLNLGAPAFGAAMSAAALSFAPLASAMGGFDIPFGVNPMTQLHAQEMVLPREYADVIRGLAGDRAEPSVVNNYFSASPQVTVHGAVDKRTAEQIGYTMFEQAQRAYMRGSATG